MSKKVKNGKKNLVPACPVEKCQNPIPARSMARFWGCPIVPLSQDNEETSVPLSSWTRKSCLVGNPSLRFNFEILTSNCFRRLWKDCQSSWFVTCHVNNNAHCFLSVRKIGEKTGKIDELECGFWITANISLVNPLDRKLANPTSLQCAKPFPHKLYIKHYAGKLCSHIHHGSQCFICFI